MDIGIWQYETKALIADLEYSSEKLSPIITAIDALQKECVRAADNLDNAILSIKTQIKNKIEKLGYDIQAKEKEYAAIGGCSFWSNLFSGWGCKRAKDKQKREIRALQEKFRGEIKTYNDVDSRMHYF